MEWKGSGNGVSEGLVVENRTGEPKHIEVDCQTSKSTVFSGVTQLDPGEVVPYSDLPDRMIQVNVRAADGPKGRKMFDPEAVSGAIVVQVTDAEVAFETTTEPYDPAMRDYTPAVDDDEGDNGDESDGSDDSEPSSDGETGNGSEPSSDDSDEKTADDGSTATTATGESAVSTTEQGQRDRTTTTADRDAGRESSDDSSSVTGSQTTRSGSTSETSARSGSETPETTSDAAGEDTAGGADERINETDRRPSQADTSGADADDTGGDEPGEGEIYCRSCGEIIRIKAELCPECGVRNVAQGMRGSSGRQPQAAAAGTTRGASRASSPGRTQPQQSAGGQAGTQEQTGSEPSGAWVNGVRIGGVLWLLVLGILIPTVMTYQNVTAGSGLDPGGMLQSLGLATLLPAVQLLAWVVLPVALYFDLKHIGYHVDEWPLNGRLYIAAALILPIFTQIFGAAALFVGSGSVVAAVIPVLMLGLCLRHLRTRSRLL